MARPQGTVGNLAELRKRDGTNGKESTVIRKAFRMTLHRGSEAEYERRHRVAAAMGRLLRSQRQSRSPSPLPRLIVTVPPRP